MESIHPQHDRDDDVKKIASSKRSPISFCVLIFAGKYVCRVSTCFGVVLFLRPTNDALTTRTTYTHSFIHVLWLIRSFFVWLDLMMMMKTKKKKNKNEMKKSHSSFIHYHHLELLSRFFFYIPLFELFKS